MLGKGASRRKDGPPQWLGVRLGRLHLDSPIVTAAGTFGIADECLASVDTRWIGAFTTKSLSVTEWRGNPSPRLTRAPAGMLNSVGLDNPGVERWIEEALPRIERHRVPIVASIWGRSIDEFSAAAELLGSCGSVVAIEVNLSCPNLEAPEDVVAHSAAASKRVVKEVVGIANERDKAVFAKLSPNLPTIVPVAEAVLEAGAEVLTISNTVLGMAIDHERLSPVLGNVTGGLSGPAIKPVVMRHIWEVWEAIGPVPIVGTGGVFNACDAIEFMAAGASAIGVGSVSFYDPRAPERIGRELAALCKSREIGDLQSIVGAAHLAAKSGGGRGRAF
jgi:dihydroorotate dehydrogenase (NAD+) catalytic subunit